MTAIPWCEACRSYHHKDAPGCFAIKPDNTARPLQQMITLWRSIEELHLKDEAASSSGNHGRLSMLASAIAVTMKHYQRILESD